MRAPGLGASGLLPSDKDYEFDTLFGKGKFGESGYETAEGLPTHFTAPIMSEVVRLEEAKRVAAAAMGELVTAKATHGGAEEGTKEALEAVRKAERRVVERRVEVLRKLMLEKDTCLVHEVIEDDLKRVVASVQYRAMRMDAKQRIFQTQSPIGLVTSVPWVLTSNLCKGPQTEGLVDPELNKQLADILLLVLKSLPYDASTERIRELAGHVLTARKNFEVKRGELTLSSHWQHSESYNKGMFVYSCNTQDRLLNNQRTTVEVILGGLNVNCCEDWHNPLINKYVQKMVAHTAAEAIQKGDSNHNTVRFSIRVTHMQEVHVLDLAPFFSPDACTVQHIFIGSGDGILDLSNKTIEDVATASMPEQHDMDADMKWYHCIGANHNRRFNEQELNFLHAEGFKENLDEDLLPNTPQHTHLQLDKKTPLGKSVRISFTDWDVLATSFRYPREDNFCGTIITLVNYPPYGTRYKKEPKYSPYPGRRGYYAERQNKPKRRAFKDLPKPGVMQYFIWYSDDAKQSWVINLIDHTEDRLATQKLMDYGVETNKHIYDDFKAENFGGQIKWITGGKEMVANITSNESLGAHGFTVRQLYRHFWGHFVKEMIKQKFMDEEGRFIPQNFPYLYSQTPEVWDEFIDDSLGLTSEFWAQYKAYSEHRFREDMEQNKIAKRGGIREQVLPYTRSFGVAGKVIPLPGGPRQLVDSTPTAVANLVNLMKEKLQILGSRIQTLESTSHDESRDHLLHVVLEKLTKRARD